MRQLAASQRACAVPNGTRLHNDDIYPALKGWAKLFRPARRDLRGGDSTLSAQAHGPTNRCWFAPEEMNSGRDPHEIREYFIPDFSNWEDRDSYQTAFQRLVKDLKAGDRDSEIGIVDQQALADG